MDEAGNDAGRGICPCEEKGGYFVDKILMCINSILNLLLVGAIGHYFILSDELGNHSFVVRVLAFIGILHYLEYDLFCMLSKKVYLSVDLSIDFSNAVFHQNGSKQKAAQSHIS
jgi:hypothetical protein